MSECFERKVTLLGLFDRINNAVFLKEDSEAEKQLRALQELKASLSGDVLRKFEQEISKVEAGIVGEKQVHFELENSHIPMFVLHDLFLEYEGLTAQIDYMIFTRKNTYIIECKNMYGDIEINNAGNFIRTYQYGGRRIKEGIYSPITQNQRHLALIKSLRGDSMNVLKKVIFDKEFYNNYHGIVVLANPKTVLSARYAKREIKEQVIRADQLVDYIKDYDGAKSYNLYSEKEMEDRAEFFLKNHKNNPVDYVERFRVMVEESKKAAASESDKASDTEKDAGTPPSCPMCGAQMVLRTAKKGSNTGNQFYGCPNYPRCKGIRSL